MSKDWRIPWWYGPADSQTFVSLAEVPDLIDAAAIAHAEVVPVGEITDDPFGGGHAKLVHVKDTSFGHQPCNN